MWVARRTLILRSRHCVLSTKFGSLGALPCMWRGYKSISKMIYCRVTVAIKNANEATGRIGQEANNSTTSITSIFKPFGWHVAVGSAGHTCSLIHSLEWPWNTTRIFFNSVLLSLKLIESSGSLVLMHIHHNAKKQVVGSKPLRDHQFLFWKTSEFISWRPYLHEHFFEHKTRDLEIGILLYTFTWLGAGAWLEDFVSKHGFFACFFTAKDFHSCDGFKVKGAQRLVPET